MVDVRLDVIGERDIPLAVSDDESAALSVETPFVAGGGTRDYELLDNKPRIEEVELVGNKELDDFGMGTASYYDIAQLFR